MKNKVNQSAETSSGACIALSIKWLSLISNEVHEGTWLQYANAYNSDESSDDDSSIYCANDYFNTSRAKASVKKRIRALQNFVLSGSSTLLTKTMNDNFYSERNSYGANSFEDRFLKFVKLPLLFHSLKPASKVKPIQNDNISDSFTYGSLFKNPESNGCLVSFLTKGATSGHVIAFYSPKKLGTDRADYSNHILAFDPNYGEFVLDSWNLSGLMYLKVGICTKYTLCM